MKYLKKCNESTSINLEEIITIELEDVSEFSLLELDIFDYDKKINLTNVTIELIEDFSNNMHISDLFDELNTKYSNLSDVSISYTKRTKATELISNIENYTKDINTAIFNKLGKKYGFVASGCNAFLETDNNTFVAESGNCLIYTGIIAIEFTILMK